MLLGYFYEIKNVIMLILWNMTHNDIISLYQVFHRNNIMTFFESHHNII